MTDKVTRDHSGTESRRPFGVYLVCGALMVMILLLDLSIPLGVAMGVPYVAVVLISLWSPQKKFTVSVAVVCSLLTIVAFACKPPVVELWKAICNRSLAIFAIWVTALLGMQIKIMEQKRQKALDDVRTLRGMLPICASCKRIRDDRDCWTQIEVYIKAHSEANFSHGICPECAIKLYPQFYKGTNHDADTDTRSSKS